MPNEQKYNSVFKVHQPMLALNDERGYHQHFKLLKLCNNCVQYCNMIVLECILGLVTHTGTTVQKKIICNFENNIRMLQGSQGVPGQWDQAAHQEEEEVS